MRAGVETSPSRRASLNSSFEAKDTLKTLNRGTAFAFCGCGLEAWSEEGDKKYGYVDRRSHE